MDIDMIFDELEKNKYIKDSAERIVFHGKLIFDDRILLFFDRNNTPRHEKYEDALRIIFEENKDIAVDRHELNYYLRKNNIDHDDFEIYLTIKSAQAGYIFNDKMTVVVSDLIPDNLFDAWSEDIEYLCENNYGAYSDIVWGILEVLYFNTSYDSIIKQYQKWGLNKMNILFNMSYITKYNRRQDKHK